MSNDERQSDSLAAQAAAWVPPWERQQRPPDRAYQAAAEAAARREAGDERPDDDEERSEANLSDDDDDFDPAFEGADPPGYKGDDEPDSDGGEREDGDAEAEEAAFAGSEEMPVSVDAPVDDPVGDLEPVPTAGEVGSELPLPGAVEEAAEEDWVADGLPADAPLPEDGDDAGDVFDLAADDDVSDDGADDLPVAEDAADDRPTGDAPDGGPTGDAADGGPTGDAADGGPTEEAADGGPSESESDASEPAGPRGKAVPEQGRRRAADSEAVDGSAAARAPERTGEDLPELTDDGEFAAALEAILLVVDEPVAEMQLAQILEQPTERVGAMLENISARYTAAGHGFDLRRAAGGWRLYTRPEYAAYVERFVLDGQSVRLTQAALETLAVVAYKQPVTRSRISAIRGVNCDGVMRTLATRGLIEECGVEGETGAHLYRTTDLFLEKLGLNSVDQLPPLAPFLPDDVEEVLDASG